MLSDNLDRVAPPFHMVNQRKAGTSDRLDLNRVAGAGGQQRDGSRKIVGVGEAVADKENAINLRSVRAQGRIPSAAAEPYYQAQQYQQRVHGDVGGSIHV